MSAGSVSSYSSKFSCRSQPRVISTAHACDAGAIAAHAEHDALREREPDLVVVLELGMPLQVDERGVPRVLVPRGVEREPVPLAGADVALRPELGAGPDEREVDVEQDGAKRHASSRSQCTVSTCS